METIGTIAYIVNNRDVQKCHSDDKVNIEWKKFILAFAKGDLHYCNNIYRLLRHDDTKAIDMHAGDGILFRIAVEKSSLQMLKLLVGLDILYFQPIPANTMNMMIQIACEKNCPEIVKYLLENIGDSRFGSIDLHANDEFLFRAHARKADLEICKMLFDISRKEIDGTPNFINVHANGDEAFWSSYHTNNLVSKWIIELCEELHQKYPEYPLVDITANNNYAFRMSILGGNLDMCQWLFYLSLEPGYKKIDIGANNRELLEYCLDRNQMKIYDWMCELEYNENDFIDDPEIIKKNKQDKEIEQFENEKKFMQILSDFNVDDEKLSVEELLLKNDIINRYYENIVEKDSLI